MNYSQIAHLYDVYVNTDIDIPFFLKEAKGCSQVLELMSGTGRLSIPLIEAGIPLTCIDNSKEMLELLRKKLTQKELAAKVYQMDICHLHLNGSYDLVIIPFHSFAEILDHHDQLKALTGIYKLLSQDGLFICTLHNPPIRLEPVNGQLKQIGEFPLPNGEGTLSLSAMENYDAANCRVTGKQVYKIYDVNGLRLSKSSIDIQFYLHEKDSFEELVKSVGFNVVEIYGDYSYSPFDTDKSPFMIWVLNKGPMAWGTYRRLPRVIY
jgi:SAM-dependent methyltransferase